jgi:hypothetical protein
MSNFLGIATVTAALSQILSEALVPDVDDAQVTTFRPDSDGNMPTTGVNIFLYQVTPNAAWQNADLPTRRANGDLVQRPRAALDLHYLLTFYGDEGKLVPQRVLGSVIRSLHAQPILTRDLIRKTIAKNEFDYLINSNLADAIELVKFTPLPLSLEDLSKLWSVYFQTPYSLSVAYQATVVLIESEDSTHAALPVRARNIYVVPFRQPLIENVRAADGAPAIVSTSALVIAGKRLRGDATQIMISGIEATAGIQTLTDSAIQLTLPAGLRAGVQGLQVIQPRLMGTPPVAHAGVASNLAAFVLHPTINKRPDLSPDITVALPNVTVKVSPAVAQTQPVRLLLNELNPPADRGARAYSFDAAPHNAPDDPEVTDTLVFSVAGVQPGDYLARVQVDGAESPLELSTDANDPVYVGPRVTFP